MAEVNEKVDIKFTDKMLELMEKKSKLVDNPNPISEAQSALFSKENKNDKELLDYVITLMMTNNSLARLLDNPKMLNNMIKSQGIFPIEKSVAERLVNDGLATSEALEKQKKLHPQEMSTNQVDDSVPTQTIEEAGAQKKEKETEKKQFAVEKLEDVDNPEIQSLNEQIKEVDKKFDEAKTEEEKAQIIAKERELAHERDNKIGKFYYLTPERMLENLETMNGGRLFKTLFNTPEKRYAVERAYLTCSDPAALTNPKFLDDRINQFLTDADKVEGLRGVHMMILSNTYVGYHVEENNVSEPGEKVQESPDKKIDPEVVSPAMVDFPAFLNDAPPSMIEEIEANIARNVNRMIQDVISGNNGYTALSILVDADYLVQKGMEQAEMQAGHDAKGKTTVAFIQNCRDRASKDVNVAEMIAQSNVAVVFSGDELTNDSARQEIVGLLRLIGNNGDKKDVEAINVDAVQNIQIYNVVRDFSEVEDLKKIGDSFQGVGIKVDINFAIDPSLEEGTVNDIRNKMIEYNKSAPPEVHFYEDVSTENSMKVDAAVGNAISEGAEQLMRTAVSSSLTPATAGAIENFLGGGNVLEDNIDLNAMAGEAMGRNIVEDDIIQAQENAMSATEATADELVEGVNQGRYERQEAINILSMSADITPNLAEKLLIENGLSALEEDDFDPMSRVYDTFNGQENN